MRILKINGIQVDLDSKTAIGIDLQSYDIKSPAFPKINVSNSFNIPRTTNNLKAIGHIGGIQSISTSIYEPLTCDYWVNNTKYISNAKARIQSIGDRIELFIYEKPSIWDELRQLSYRQFMLDYFDWLDIPKFGDTFTGTWDEFVSQYIVAGGQDNLYLPVFRGSEFEDFNTLAMVLSNIRTSNGARASGGHFCSFLKPVFEFIEDTYSVNFNTSGNFDGNIFNDTVFNSMYWVYKDIAPYRYASNFYFEMLRDGDNFRYGGDSEGEECGSLTLFDFVVSVFQQFGIIVTQNIDSSEFKLRRFDELINIAPVVDFSGKMASMPKLVPYVDGYAQNSVIKFKDVESGLSEETNARKITSLNKNLDEKTELFTINAYIPSFIGWADLTDKAIPNIVSSDSFKNFKFFIDSDVADFNTPIDLYVDGVAVETTTKGSLNIPGLYSLDSEYTLLDEALNYPMLYNIEKWVNSIDLINFDFYKLYYIRELNGSFFVNKIKGFNPDKSKQATTFELLKVSDKTPDIDVVTEPWSDGLGTAWTDGVGTEWKTKIA